MYNVILSLIVFALVGCATSRSVIEIPMPLSSEISKANGKEIYINSVTDKRLFEVSPRNPNIPSLDPSEKQGSDIQLRAIARKRNTYGQGLGDILLPEGKTVNGIIESAIKQALIENGYKVIDNKQEITNNTSIIDTQINKFWSWMNPGFWALTLSAEISTDIIINDNNRTDNKTISITASDTFQTGAESNWAEVIQSAVKAYMAELKLKFK